MNLSGFSQTVIRKPIGQHLLLENLENTLKKICQWSLGFSVLCQNFVLVFGDFLFQVLYLCLMIPCSKYFTCVWWFLVPSILLVFGDSLFQVFYLCLVIPCSKYFSSKVSLKIVTPLKYHKTVTYIYTTAIDTNRLKPNR